MKIEDAVKLLYKGEKYSLFIFDPDQNDKLMNFSKGLEKSDREKVIKLLQRSADKGPPNNTEKFRYEGDGIYCFKSYQVRITCFYDKDQLIILDHGFFKKQDNMPKKEKDLAMKAKERYFKIKEGSDS